MASNIKIGENPETELADVKIPIPCSTNDQSNQMGSHNLQNSSCPSPNISESKSSRDSLLRRRSRTFNGRPKSRFGEPPVLIDSDVFKTLSSSQHDQIQVEPHTKKVTWADVIPHATRKAKEEREKEKEKEKGKQSPDEYEIYRRITAQLRARNRKKMTFKLLLQLLFFLLILAGFICSLFVDRFKGKEFHGLEIWKWFLLLMVTFSGLLITHWVVHLIVFLIEWKFLLRKNVVYFTYGLKNSIKVFIWIGEILLTWLLLFRPVPEIERSSRAKKMVHFLTWTLVSLFIGSFLWLLKTTLIKFIASFFRFNRFFDRIQESTFHHYVLQTLSGHPVLACKNSKEKSFGKVSFKKHTGIHKEKKVVDWEKLHQMKKEKVPSWTMQLLANVISNSGLTTMSSLFKKDVVEGGVALDDDEITTEEEAIATAVKIYKHIVGDTVDKNYIEADDLLKFMIEEEVDLVYPLFEQDANGHISLKGFSKWVVNVFKERKALQHALNDNRTVVKEFDILLTAIMIVSITVLWLILTEIATKKILLFIASQLLVFGFMFKNTGKTIFESIVFVFVMHPFDVGDRCSIDGMRMVVEEMNIFSTVFLKADKEKVYYPNAVLATKAIGNFYRSPDQGDFFEFAIEYATPLPTIDKLGERIKQYLEQNQTIWQLNHTLAVKEIENLNKITMVLNFNHTMNFQDWPEKIRRRTKLILNMKSIFDELHIKYHLPPQDIHICSMKTCI